MRTPSAEEGLIGVLFEEGNSASAFFGFSVDASIQTRLLSLEHLLHPAGVCTSAAFGRARHGPSKGTEANFRLFLAGVTLATMPLTVLSFAAGVNGQALIAFEYLKIASAMS